MRRWKKLVNEVKYGPAGPPNPWKSAPVAASPPAAAPAEPHAKPSKEMTRAKISNLGVAVYLTTDDRIVVRRSIGKDESGPVAGAVAAVETAGGIAALSTSGALGQRVVDKREAYLTISGDGLAVVLSLSPGFTGAARQFAAAVNAASRAASAAHAAPTDVSPAVDRSPTELLTELAKLRDAGVLTPAEFDAKKTEILGRI